MPSTKSAVMKTAKARGMKDLFVIKYNTGRYALGGTRAKADGTEYKTQFFIAADVASSLDLPVKNKKMAKAKARVAVDPAVKKICKRRMKKCLATDLSALTEVAKVASSSKAPGAKAAKKAVAKAAKSVKAAVAKEAKAEADVKKAVKAVKKAASAVVEGKRGPGRPKGSKNKPKAASAKKTASGKRGPGRPKGSKNKPKA